jgi:hypothetical protein
MSYPVKLTLFLLAFNIIGFAGGLFAERDRLLLVSPYPSCDGFWGRAGESAMVEGNESLMMMRLPRPRRG